uniref:UspA domain-containing protein n=1 Tax=Aegilops tauschii TaxID=37682 RepID=N1QVC6_AEGTA
MKERLCLEAERLGLSAMIMGSRGFGASRRAGNGRLGSVSDYCVHHCVCPVVVVRYPDDAGAAGGAESVGDELRTVPENEVVFHEAPEGQKGNEMFCMIRFRMANSGKLNKNLDIAKWSECI